MFQVAVQTDPIDTTDPQTVSCDGELLQRTVKPSFINSLIDYLLKSRLVAGVTTVLTSHTCTFSVSRTPISPQKDATTSVTAGADQVLLGQVTFGNSKYYKVISDVSIVPAMLTLNSQYKMVLGKQ